MTKEVSNDEGARSADALLREARAEELRTEESKGSDLAKGADRFEERSRSSDGRSSGEKQ